MPESKSQQEDPDAEAPRSPGELAVEGAGGKSRRGGYGHDRGLSVKFKRLSRSGRRRTITARLQSGNDCDVPHDARRTSGRH